MLIAEVGVFAALASTTKSPQLVETVALIVPDSSP